MLYPHPKVVQTPTMDHLKVSRSDVWGRYSIHSHSPPSHDRSLCHRRRRLHLQSEERWALSVFFVPSLQWGISALLCPCPAFSNQGCPSLTMDEGSLKANRAHDFGIPISHQGVLTAFPSLFTSFFSITWIKYKKIPRGICWRTKRDKRTVN